MPVAQAARGAAGCEEDAGLIGQQRRGRVEHSDVDELPAIRALARKKSEHDPVRREDARNDVGDGDAEAVGWAIRGARDAHQPPFGLHDGVVSGQVAPGPGLSEAGDRTVDESRVVGGDPLVPDPHAIHRAGPEVLDEHVRFREQTVENVPRLAPLQVERDALFVPVDAQEVGALSADERRPPGAGVVPLPRLLDLDDARAHVGEQHRAVRPGQHAREVDDDGPGERPFRIGHNRLVIIVYTTGPS